MSAGMAHQPVIQPEATSVGARWRMTCPACPGLTTPPMSKQGAELARERHEYETETVRA